ncbi:hypothetical protein FVER53590_08739 [Fusarium verticillioides]|nr:hypothetical protein FVER53590_08739 [Fusarium verticillioides]
MFCIPFFDFQHNSLCFYALAADIRLPWQVLEYKSTGGSGTVYKLQIHPGHHNFKSESQDSHEMTYFALKKIDWIDRQAYRDELEALQRSRAQITQDRHLIRLLLALQHGERLYLLFEWADGNLLNLWDEVPYKDPSGSTIQRWAANQCFGVANAVRRIHGLTTGQIQRRSSSPNDVTDKIKEWGRHGDIKPSNILWFKKYKGDDNVLVVSDLGLTRYHSLHTKSLVPRIDGYTSAYAAPELELNQPISQKYDIWSLGCVFLEFCIWYVKGNDAVIGFGLELGEQHESDISNFDYDNYFIIKTEENGKKSAQLKPAVTTWIADLRDIARGSDFVLKMLELIQHRMLVVDVDKRWPISLVCREILDIRSSLPKLEHTEDLLLGIGVGAEQA